MYNLSTNRYLQVNEMDALAFLGFGPLRGKHSSARNKYIFEMNSYQSAYTSNQKYEIL